MDDKIKSLQYRRRPCNPNSNVAFGPARFGAGGQKMKPLRRGYVWNFVQHWNLGPGGLFDRYL